MLIDERREKVLKLYESGKHIKEMAQILGVGHRAIERDISALKSQNRITKTRQEFRQERVKKLYEEGKFLEEIADIENVTTTAIKKDIRELAERGQIQPRNRFREIRMKERQQIVMRLYNEGKSVSAISALIGVSNKLIYKDIQKLKQENKIESGIRKQKRQEQTVILYSEGKSITEIAQEMQVSMCTVYSDINNLMKYGKIVSPPKTQKEKERDERTEEILKLVNEGKKVTDIAKELGVTRTTIYNHLKNLETKVKVIINAYIKEQKNQEAKEFIDACLNNNYLSQEFQAKLIKFKEEIEKVEEKEKHEEER